MLVKVTCTIAMGQSNSWLDFGHQAKVVAFHRQILSKVENPQNIKIVDTSDF